MASAPEALLPFRNADLSAFGFVVYLEFEKVDVKLHVPVRHTPDARQSWSVPRVVVNTLHQLPDEGRESPPRAFGNLPTQRLDPPRVRITLFIFLHPCCDEHLELHSLVEAGGVEEALRLLVTVRYQTLPLDQVERVPQTV